MQPGALEAAMPIGYVPVESPLDSVVEGNALAAALERATHRYWGWIAYDGREQIVEILRRNSLPRDMYAMIRNYQGDMVGLIGRVTGWSDSQWVRVQAYLGDQLPLDVQIQRHRGDRDAVLRDLQRIPDEQALALIIEQDSMLVIQPKPVTEYDPVPPAHTTRALVEAALKSALSSDGYVQAVRLFLQKAASAQRASVLRRPMRVDSGLAYGLDGVAPFHVVALPGTDHDELVVFDAVADAHLSLVLDIVREADTKDWDRDANARSRAFFALADLTQVERRIAITRLDQTITKNPRELGTLEMILKEDDAEAIGALLANGAYIATTKHQEVDTTTLDFAMERASTLVQNARGKVDATAVDSDAKKQAQADYDRVAGQVLDWALLSALRREPALLEQRLRALGASPLQIGIELLQQASSSDFDEIIATIKRIDPAVRVQAMIKSGKLDLMPRFEADQRELLAAYLTVSDEAKVDPTTTKLLAMPASTALLYYKQSPPSELPYVERDDPGGLILDMAVPRTYFQLIEHDLFSLRPRTTIAIADILEDLANNKGPAALGRIRRLEENDRIEVFADARVRKAIDSVADEWLRSALREAWWNADGEIGVFAVKTRDTQAIFEATAVRGDMVAMRRGFVLAHRLADSPTYQLSADEKSAIDAYQIAIAKWAPLSGWQDKETFRHILFGQPQLGGPNALDPTMEAEFMAFRVTERAGTREPHPDGLQDRFEDSGPEADEAVARFRVYFTQVRDGGVTPSELAQLSDLYHAAMRALDKFREDNVSSAHKVAHIVAAVVGAVVLIALTMGAATPFVAAALTGLAAGTAAAASGAIVRTESSLGEVAMDFTSGTIDGVMMVVGNELGAAAVEAAWGTELVGAGAGAIASRAAGEAMKKVSKGFFATIVENAIAGAVGGAASEMFETAADRVTWDRGIAEGFSRMLAAVARGAQSGALMGGGAAAGIGVVGKLGSITLNLLRSNPRAVADGVTRLLGASGAEAAVLERLAETSEAQLVKVHELIEAGEIGEAEQLLERLELPSQARAAMRAFARERVAASAIHELGGLPHGTPEKFTTLSADAFKKKVGDIRGDAAVVVENGEANVYLRAGSRASVIREEYVHLAQFYGDRVMRAKMMMLSRENVANWVDKTVEQQAQIYVAHLEVEANAQRRILAMVEEDAARGDADALMRELDAQETLNKLDEKLQGVRDARTAGTLEQAVPTKPPVLFGRGAQTPRISKTAGRQVKALLETPRGLTVPRDLATLKQYGYRPGYAKGTIFRLSRVSEATETMPHLQVGENGKVQIAERPSFAEQRFDAEQEWRSTSDAIAAIPAGLRDADPLVREAARAQHESLALEFHKRLAAKVASNEIDEASAGMLLKWGEVIEEIDQRVGGAAGKRVINEMLDKIPTGSGGPKALTEPEITSFRRAVRTRTVDYLKNIKDGKQRMVALRDMLKAQPEPSSQGSLFTAFRREVMFSTQESPSIPTNLFSEVERPIEVFKLPRGVTRTPDDAVTLNAKFHKLKKGRYALEDKAGDHAFRIDQARHYARGLEKGNSSYDGLLYVFSNEIEAEAARLILEKDGVTKKLLGIHGGIHVTFFDIDGRWDLL